VDYRRVLRQLFWCLIPLALIAEQSSFAQLSAGASAGIGTNFLGWQTNGPAIGRIYQFTMTSTFTNGFGKVIRRPVSRNFTSMTNFVLDHLAPDSLHFRIWTNLLARTNGCTTRIWSVRSHPEGWPRRPPIVSWDTNGLMWGMRGLTALSPCWEIEGAPGQVPVTALTPRHGYTRGHSLGPPGFSDVFRGKKVWFVTTNNVVIQATVVDSVNGSHIGQDYTILFFKDDLPTTIQPMRVLYPTNLVAKYPYSGFFNSTFLKSEQSGQVSAGIPGFTVNTWKGGDSGSPNMLPFFDELIFISGRSTSPPSAQIQADMDELCRRQRVNPKRYQMQCPDLSSFPSYKP
jgi:hypothetical protein